MAWTLILLALGVGYQNAKQRAFIADGAAWLWKLQEAYFASETPILDWYYLAPTKMAHFINSGTKSYGLRHEIRHGMSAAPQRTSG